MAQTSATGPIDLKALEECASRIREQVDRLTAKEEDDDEEEDDDLSNNGDDDDERSTRSHPHRRESETRITKSFSEVERSRLGLTDSFFEERRRTRDPVQQSPEDPDGSDEEGSNSDGGEFLVFHRSELRRADETFNVGMSHAHVQDLLANFRADERATLAQGIADWFSAAARHADTMQDELNQHELNCTQEEMNMEEAYRDLGTHLQSRDVKTIQHMRRFYDKIQELRPKSPVETPDPDDAAMDWQQQLQQQQAAMYRPKKVDREERMKRMMEELRAEQVSVADGGRSSVASAASGPAQARQSGILKAGGARKASKASGSIARSASKTAGASRGPSGSVALRIETDGLEPPEEEGYNPTSLDLTRRRGYRANLLGAAELLRSAKSQEKIERKEKKRRTMQLAREEKKKDNAGSMASGGALASGLLEVISQQQDEIAHLKTRNDFSAKGTESMRMALEYMRSQNDRDEHVALTGQSERSATKSRPASERSATKSRPPAVALPEAAQEVLNDMRDNLRIKTICEFLSTKEGRVKLRNAENLNPLVASQLRAAELMEEVEQLSANLQELDAEVSQTIPPAQRMEVLRREIEAQKAEIARRAASRNLRRRGSGSKEKPGTPGAPSETSPSRGRPGAGTPGGPQSGGSRAPSKAAPGGGGGIAASAMNVSWMSEAPEDVVKRVDAIFSEVDKDIHELQEQKTRVAEALNAAKLRVALEELEKIQGLVNFKDSPEDATMEDLKNKVKDLQQTLIEVRDEAQALQTEETDLRAELKMLRESKKQTTQALTAVQREEAKAVGVKSSGQAKLGQSGPDKDARGSVNADPHGHEEESAARAEGAEGAGAHAGAAAAAGQQKLAEKLRAEIDTTNENIQRLEVQRGELAARVERMRKAREETAEVQRSETANSKQGSPERSGGANEPSTPQGRGTKTSSPVAFNSPSSRGVSFRGPDSPNSLFTQGGSSASSATSAEDPIGPDGLPMVILNSPSSPAGGGPGRSRSTSAADTMWTEGTERGAASPISPGSARSRRTEVPQGSEPFARSLSVMSGADGGGGNRSAGGSPALQGQLLTFPESAQSRASSRARSMAASPTTSPRGERGHLDSDVAGSRPGSVFGGPRGRSKQSAVDLPEGLLNAVRNPSRAGSPRSDAEGFGSSDNSEHSQPSQHVAREGSGGPPAHGILPALPAPAGTYLEEMPTPLGEGTRYSMVMSHHPGATEGNGSGNVNSHMSAGSKSTVVVDKREEQVQDLLKYQSEHTRLERQIAEIEDRIREAKLKASGKKVDSARPTSYVKSLLIPEENRNMRKEVTSKQRELNLLRKRWWKEKKSQGGATDNIFEGQADAVARFLILNPPEAPVIPVPEDKSDEGSGSRLGSTPSEEPGRLAASRSSSKELREEEKPEEPQGKMLQRRGSTLGRAWFGLEPVAANLPTQPVPNMQRRHSIHPLNAVPEPMGTLEGRKVGSTANRDPIVPNPKQLAMRRRSSIHALTAGLGGADAEEQGGDRMSPMDQFERVIVSAGARASAPAGAVPKLQRRGTLAAGMLMRRRDSVSAAQLEGAVGAQGFSGLVVTRAGKQSKDKGSNSSGSLSDGSGLSDSEGGDKPKKSPGARSGLRRQPRIARSGTVSGGLGEDAEEEAGRDVKRAPLLRRGSVSHMALAAKPDPAELQNTLLVSSPQSSQDSVARQQTGLASLRDLRSNIPLGDKPLSMSSSPMKLNAKEVRAIMQPILEK